MIPGTTPTLHMRLTDDTVDLGEALDVFFTLRQGIKEITKSGRFVSVSGNQCSVWLEQSDTIDLQSDSPAKIQLNWTYLSEGVIKRNATKPATITISEQLLRRVIA